MSNSTRIAKNTIALYFRQILIMLVSLYTVRVVLATLGAEDYGIYNVVAGVVTMFSFLSGAMATASQRFFSFEMGKGNNENLSKIFSVTLTIYAVIAIIIIVLAETTGLWFVNTKLVVPVQRLTAARWIYQCAVLSFLFTILTTPYMSLIIAHENMNIYAYVSIVEALLKLAVVFVLKIGKLDKLILYGILLLCVAVINTSLYR
ncbi:MAG: oligosaccharide flippase family protein, partial [Treponema sp.]